MVSKFTHDFFWMWGFIYSLALAGVFACGLMAFMFYDLTYVSGPDPFTSKNVLFLLQFYIPIAGAISELIAMLAMWHDERIGCYQEWDYI